MRIPGPSRFRGSGGTSKPVIEPLESRQLLSGDLYILNSPNNASGSIDVYTTSGAAVSTPLVTGLGTSVGMTVDNGGIFVLEYTGGNNGAAVIVEYSVGGTVLNGALVSGLIFPIQIASSGSDLFVTEQTNSGGGVAEFTTTGATVNANLITGISIPGGIAVSGSDIFVVSGDGEVGEYTTSGATVNAALITGLTAPGAITVSGNDLFVGTAAGIEEYTTSGTAVANPLINANADFPTIDGTNLYAATGADKIIGAYTTSGSTVNSSLITGFSSGIAGMVFADTPFAPEGVTATEGTLPHHVALTWDGVAGATTYQVFRSIVNSFATATNISGGLSTLYFNDTTATPGVQYYYWVRARNPSWVGMEAAPVTGYIPLPAPGNLVAVNDPHHVQLTWAAVSGATSYNILRSTTNNSANATTISSGQAATNFNDTTAVFGTTYFYWVQARNAVGAGVVSTDVTGSITA